MYGWIDGTDCCKTDVDIKLYTKTFFSPVAIQFLKCIENVIPLAKTHTYYKVWAGSELGLGFGEL